jgi:hypothetical protein
MPAPASTCTLETAHHEDGIWHLRTVVITPQGTRSGTHSIEGDVDMTDAALSAAVLALYA